MATDPDVSAVEFGSDAIAIQLRRLGIDWVAMVPGSTYKGLHDSLVNFNGNTKPEMLVCLHEEHPVHMAQGYAKVANKPMAVALHANVGLMHATMAIYNAYCDRVPILILGATGPLDAHKRRPWIDWVHTSIDQAALIRPFIKMDDQPHSANAALAAVVHATVSTAAKPCAPTYVCLDSAMQEGRVEPEDIQCPSTERYLSQASRDPGPSTTDVDDVIRELSRASQTVFLLGRMTASSSNWNERIALIESFPNAKVLTDLKQIAPFPTPHAQQPIPPGVFPSPAVRELLKTSDLLISLDWVDLGGTLGSQRDIADLNARIVHVSLDSALHNGWSQDHFAQPPADIMVRADPDAFVSALWRRLQDTKTIPIRPRHANGAIPRPISSATAPPRQTILMSDLSSSLYKALPPEQICLARIPLSWTGSELRAIHPFSYLGQDGGAGLASGPANVIGAALALKDLDSPLHAVGVVGDGDFLMGCTALWTAARHRIPLLVVVANNRSFFNDEVHQERVANARLRSVENKWIGMRLDYPAPNLHALAESLGCTVVRKAAVEAVEDLLPSLKDAALSLKNGATVVLDIKVAPDGYRTALETGRPAGI